MKIKMGFIGVGGRGLGMLERTLKKFPNVDVVAVCDTYEDRAMDCKKLIKDMRIVCFKSSMSKNVKGENGTYLRKIYEALAPQSFVNLYSYHAFLLGLSSMGYLEPTDHDFVPRTDNDLFQYIDMKTYRGSQSRYRSR